MTIEQLKERHTYCRSTFMDHCLTEPQEQRNSLEYRTWEEKLEQLRADLIDASHAYHQAVRNNMIRKYNERKRNLVSP